jgi:hypothetical protein
MALPLVPIIGVGIVALIALASKGGSSKAALPSGTFNASSGTTYTWQVVRADAPAGFGGDGVQYYRGQYQAIVEGALAPLTSIPTSLSDNIEQTRLLTLEALGIMDDKGEV